MRDSKSWTIAYAAILSLFCATALTVTSGIAKPYYLRNKERERLGLSLRALGIPVPDGGTIEETYAAFVRTGETGGVEYLEYRDGGKLMAVAFDAEGQGLWSTIKAYVALEPDLETVRSIAVYEEQETPGLGAEIESEGFRGQFPGKRLLDEAGNLALRVAKAGSARPGEIDGISGATITGEGVNRILAKVAEMARTVRRVRGSAPRAPSGTEG
ncbi:MAG: FMN-binding protein [Planctomycetes bacterium]|nr:FMN-binding protein [Planctomycetota bacterium]